MKLQKAGIYVFCAVLHGYAVADESGVGSNVSSAGELANVKRLEKEIKTTRIENQALQDRNRELSSRMKELEARIMELKRGMVQEEENPTNQ